MFKEKDSSNTTENKWFLLMLILTNFMANFMANQQKTEAVVQRCFVKKVFLEISQNPQGQNLFFNKVVGFRPATLLKKRLWHRCFPVSFVKFLRTPSFTEQLRWLLLGKPLGSSKKRYYGFLK